MLLLLLLLEFSVFLLASADDGRAVGFVVDGVHRVVGVSRVSWSMARFDMVLLELAVFVHVCVVCDRVVVQVVTVCALR